MTILALGSDSRTSAGDPEEWSFGAQRTDAIMLAQVSGDRRHVSVMSIPRDSWVPIPGWGTHKINAAFSWGGPSLMVQTVEDLVGVRIDHVVIVDFSSFVALTDALGGVDIFLPDGLQHGKAQLVPGTHRLDGAQALAYTRDRTDVPGGDFGRMQRQQNWIRAMFKAASSERLAQNPAGVLGLLETVAANVAVDETFTMTKMRGLAWSMIATDLDDGVFFTAPVAELGRSPDGRQAIVLLDETRLDAIGAAFAEDRVPEFLETHPDGLRQLDGAVH
ncbi:LCP family protein [Georgenia subflava]|uniref:LCP family protein n=1 Tax=Georgenia subflava TaxID=1622177 RepID=UPI001D013E7D|nr:LCP family protein [Georgenia subflava]